MKISDEMKIALKIGFVVLVVVILFVAVKKIDNTDAEELAKCLTNNGVKMYGSIKCSHCAEQKALFGDAFKFIDYVECTTNQSACSNLEGVPAWEIKDKIYYGVMGLGELKSLNECE